VSKSTEILLKIGAILAIVYFGYIFTEKAVLWPWQERQGRINAEQRVQQCQTEVNQFKNKQ
jgi:hypothetical protein